MKTLSQQVYKNLSEFVLYGNYSASMMTHDL